MACGTDEGAAPPLPDAAAKPPTTEDMALDGDAGADATTAADAAPAPLEDAGPCFGAANGTSCGSGKICAANICTDTSCGDGVTTAPEECDLGVLNGPSGGCTTSCKFPCLSSDTSRNCASTDPCITAGACDDAKHICSVGMAVPLGTTCGTNKICTGTSCGNAQCGDGLVTAPEECDNGASNGPGTGCETTCKFSCSNAAVDCAAVACNTRSCSATHTCQTTADATKNGMGCGNSYVCNGGSCAAPGAVCGNGTKEGGEDCDFGVQNGAGTGCESNCKFSCTTSPNSCVDANACHVAPTCGPVAVNGKAGQKCVTGADKADGAACGGGSICLGVLCKLSSCGDSFRDDPKGEQCDDGNVTNLDGCDASCKFEQGQRATTVKMQYGTDAFCTANKLGGAIASAAQSSFQTDMNASVTDGSMSVLFKLVGNDLSGQSGPVTIGSVSGIHAVGAGYDGNSDLEWWYTADPNAIDASRNARAQLVGNYTGGVVDATGNLSLIMLIGGSLSNLNLSTAHLKAIVGASSKPLASAGTTTPGHLASERLSPTLTSFERMGGTNAAPTAQLCGNVSALSLANTAVSSNLLPGGAQACTQGYSVNNRFIDVLVGGCTVKFFGFNVPAINAAQPDKVDPAAPAAGAGGPYTFTVDSSKRVNGCKDKSNAAVNLAACLNAAAYSSSFKFAADRVIIK